MSRLFKVALEEGEVADPALSEEMEVVTTMDDEIDRSNQEEEIVALESQLDKLVSIANTITSGGGITKNIVMEARTIVPDFGNNKPLAMYSNTASAIGSEVALETIMETIKTTVKRIVDAIMKFLRKVKDFLFGTARKIKESKFADAVRKFKEAYDAKTRNPFGRDFDKAFQDAFDEIRKKNMNSGYTPTRNKVDDILKTYASSHKDDAKFHKLYSQHSNYFGAFILNTKVATFFVKSDDVARARKKIHTDLADVIHLVTNSRFSEADMDFVNKTPEALDKLVNTEIEQLKSIIENHKPKVDTYGTMSLACKTVSETLDKFDFNKELDEQEAFLEQTETEISNILDKSEKFNDDPDTMSVLAKTLSQCNKNIFSVVNAQLFLEAIIDKMKSFVSTGFYIDTIIVREIEKNYHDAGLTPPMELSNLHKRLSAALVV